MNKISLDLVKDVLCLVDTQKPFTFGVSVLTDYMKTAYPYEDIRDCLIDCIFCELIEADDAGFLPSRIPAILGLTQDGYRFLHEFLDNPTAFDALQARYEPDGVPTYSYFHSWVLTDTPISTETMVDVARTIQNTPWNDVIYIGKKKRAGTLLEKYSLAEVLFAYQLLVSRGCVIGSGLMLGSEPSIGKSRLSLHGDEYLRKTLRGEA